MKPSTVCSHDKQQQKINNIKANISRLMTWVDQSDIECNELKLDVKRLRDNLKEMNHKHTFSQ